jgi:hypothetical protein
VSGDSIPLPVLPMVVHPGAIGAQLLATHYTDLTEARQA